MKSANQTSAGSRAALNGRRSRTPIRVWFLAARPKTLAAAIAPVIMGSAMAWSDGGFHFLAALCALVGAVLIQIGVNYANDYADFVKGTDSENRLGPARATHSGMVTLKQMRAATVIVYVLTLLPGAYLVWRGGWPILLIGVLSIVFGILYTSGPLPLGYVGLADVAVLVFFGPVAVAGSHYAQALALSKDAIIAGLSPGLLAVAILTVNNLRDVEQDRAAGKKTLAVRFGPSFARVEYFAALMIGSVGIPLYLGYCCPAHAGVMAAAFTSLVALSALRSVFRRPDGPRLNQALAQTGAALLLFSIVFAIGWNA